MRTAQSSYWRNVFAVFSGTAFAQAIPILGSLIIARIYAPEAFGIYSTWLGIGLVLAICLTIRLEAAFGLEPDGVSRTYLVSAAVIIVLIVGCLLFACLIVTYWFVGEFAGLPPGLLFLLIPLSTGVALGSIWQSWAANNGDTRNLSLIRIVQSLFVTSLQIGVGYVYSSAASLAIAHVLGVWTAVFFAVGRMPLSGVSFSNIVSLFAMTRENLLKYKRFPIYSLPADLLNSSAAQLPIIVLGTRFGPEVAGYFALASRTMGAPISILGGAVRDVFKRSANQDFQRYGNCRGIYVRTFWVLSALAVLMVIVVAPFASTLFSFAFGKEWQTAGVFASWLIPMYALRFVASPLSYTFYVVQKQQVDLVWQIALLAMTVATLFSFTSYSATIVSYSVGYAALYTVYLLLSYSYSKSHEAFNA